MVLRELNELRVLMQLEHAGAALQLPVPTCFVCERITQAESVSKEVSVSGQLARSLEVTRASTLSRVFSRT